MPFGLFVVFEHHAHASDRSPPDVSMSCSNGGASALCSRPVSEPLNRAVHSPWLLWPLGPGTGSSLWPAVAALARPNERSAPTAMAGIFLCMVVGFDPVADCPVAFADS